MWPIAAALTFSAVNLSIALLIQACLTIGSRADRHLTERERSPVTESLTFQYVRPAVPHHPLAAFAALGRHVDSHLA